MRGRRVLYSMVLLGCFIFYLAYQEWLAWFLFMILVSLPWFSLLVSLPAMLTIRLYLSLPQNVVVGESVQLQTKYHCPLPAPLWRCKLVVERPLTGQRWKLRDFAYLPTEHCGTLLISVKRARIHDYMGLSKFPARFPQRYHRVCVHPVPVPVENLPSLDQCRDIRWKPKPGGGYSENHELRLYRPGDSIQQIHWKLSAKTGNLILREPMEPVRNRVLVRMDLTGTPQILTRKLGQVLWIGQKLLENDVHFQLQCLTGIGKELWPITCQTELEQAVEMLLGRPQPTIGTLQSCPEIASWQYFIGGDGREA